MATTSVMRPLRSWMTSPSRRAHAACSFAASIACFRVRKLAARLATFVLERPPALVCDDMNQCARASRASTVCCTTSLLELGFCPCASDRAVDPPPFVGVASVAGARDLRLLAGVRRAGGARAGFALTRRGILESAGLRALLASGASACLAGDRGIVGSERVAGLAAGQLALGQLALRGQARSEERRVGK